jgi:hypothetical protein
MKHTFSHIIVAGVLVGMSAGFAPVYAAGPGVGASIKSGVTVAHAAQTSLGITAAASGTASGSLTGLPGVRAGASITTSHAGDSGAAASSSASAQARSLSAIADLRLAIASGTLTSSSVRDIVDLHGNALGLIKNSADLDAYDNLVVAARPAVRHIAITSDNAAAISYAQPAKFLGLFSATIPAQLDVNASGTTEVHLPWYAFLYATTAANVRSAVANVVAHIGSDTAVQAQASASSTAGSSVAADATTTTSVAIQHLAEVVNAVTAALQEDLSGGTSASASGTVQTGA